nr:polysaccharide biosynthesis/export family protein [Candidatus Krumholzibacteria bacterium]
MYQSSCQQHVARTCSLMLLGLFLLLAAVPAPAQEFTPQMLEEASRQTGLSKEELMRRYQTRAGQASSLKDTAGIAEPGRTSLEGVDDSIPAERFRDTEESVLLPLEATLLKEREEALAQALASEALSDETGGFFGADFFQMAPESFAPPTFGPVPADYQLGVGDEVVVNVWGGIEFQETRVVDRDGAIILPRGGKIMCAGRSLGQVDQAVRQALARSHSTIDTGSGGDTQVEVTLGQLRAIRVFVVGAVHRPGSYEVSSVASVLTALFAAGGPHEGGSLRD